MLKYFNLESGRLVESTEPAAVVHVYTNPDDAEKKHLIEALRVDEHTLASSQDPDEIARLEFEPEHTAIIFKRPKSYSATDNFLFRVLPTGVFLFQNRIVLVLTEDASLFDTKSSYKLQTPLDMVLRLLYSSVQHFLGHLKVIDMLSASIETQIHTSMENKYLLHLFTLEKSLVFYLSAINTNATLMEKMKANAGKLAFTPEQIEFLDDIIIENQQCYRQAEIYSQVLSSLMDARASIVSNNLNRLMKTLTIITIAIMASTLIVSIFSMNVPLPLPQNHYISFWLVMLLSALAVAAVVIVGRLRKW